MRVFAVIAAVGLELLLLAGCGGGTPAAPPLPAPTPAPPPTPTAPPPPTLTPAPVAFNVEITEYKFDKPALEVRAGQKVAMNLTNKSSRLPHSLNFHGYDALNQLIGNRVDAGASRSAELVFDRPGYYPFFCPVGTHENQGLVGQLRVLGPSTGAPSIKIRAPRADRPVRGSPATVWVGVQVNNFELDKAAIGGANKAGSGHWHVLLNGQYVAATADLYFALKGVPVGTHTLKVELHNNDHSPVTPAVEDAITLRVEPPPTPTPAPTPTPGTAPAPRQQASGSSDYSY